MAEEKTLFKGSPSLLIKLGSLVLCFLLIAGGIAAGFLWNAWAALLAGAAFLYLLAQVAMVKASSYEVTTERIRIQRGIFTKRTDEVELYRVKDATLVEPFFYRVCGIGTIEVVTHDTTNPLLCLKAIKGARQLREDLRNSVEEVRERKKVRMTELE